MASCDDDEPVYGTRACDASFASIFDGLPFGTFIALLIPQLSAQFGVKPARVPKVDLRRRVTL